MDSTTEINNNQTTIELLVSAYMDRYPDAQNPLFYESILGQDLLRKILEGAGNLKIIFYNDTSTTQVKYKYVSALPTGTNVLKALDENLQEVESLRKIVEKSITSEQLEEKLNKFKFPTLDQFLTKREASYIKKSIVENYPNQIVADSGLVIKGKLENLDEDNKLDYKSLKNTPDLSRMFTNVQVHLENIMFENVARLQNLITANSGSISSVTTPLSITSKVLSITQADTTHDGSLSSTDWNTFNNKQTAIGYTAQKQLVPGSGTGLSLNKVMLGGTLTQNANFTLAGFSMNFNGTTGAEQVNFADSILQVGSLLGGQGLMEFRGNPNTAIGTLLGVFQYAYINAGSIAGISANDFASYYSLPSVATSGTITNVYAIYMDALSISSGAVTNNYAIYQLDSTARSYFNGNVGIGLNSATSPLHVAPTIAAVAAATKQAIVLSPTFSGVNIGTMLAAYGMYSKPVINLTGTNKTITTFAALFLDTPTLTSGVLTNKYAIFQADTASKNSFAGDIVKIKNVTYSWPASQGGAGTKLTNDGAGNLTWV